MSNKKKKVLWLSDFDLIGSGYLNLSTPLVAGLVEKGVDVRVIGMGYKGQQHDFPFQILPCRSANEAFAMVQNFYNWKMADVLVMALDIPWLIQWQEKIAEMKDLEFWGIYPVEASPLTESWALGIASLTKRFCISKFGTKICNDLNLETQYLEIGLDTDSWKHPTDEARQAARMSLGFSKKNFVVLTIADNQERKNLALNLDVFAKFSKTNPEARYIIVTRINNPVGYKLYDLIDEYGIGDKVFLFERGMEYSKLYLMYAASDAFLLLSKSEGLGMPLLEAMAVGIPCVATDCTGMKEVLGDDRGYLVPHDYQIRDTFGNGTRYFANPIEAVNALQRIKDDGKDATLTEKAKDFVGARDWTQGIEALYGNL